MRFMWGSSFVAVAASLVAGCSSSSGPVIEGDRYGLITVDGVGLPFVVSRQNTTEGELVTSITNALLILKPDSTIRLDVGLKNEVGGSTTTLNTPFGGSYRIVGDTLLRLCVNCDFAQGDEVYVANYTVGGFTLPRLYPGSLAADYRFALQ
jgi:hypothetical protein